MLDYIKLLRPKDWAKNLFLFIPAFFAQNIFDGNNLQLLIGGFFAFCFLASSIYILNDYRDREDDRKHPVKNSRPLATGTVKASTALVMAFILLAAGAFLAYSIDASGKFLFICGLYYLLNLAYSFGLKNIPVLDMLIVASGFVLRVKGGATLTDVNTTEWLIIMTFLLALFMAVGKRRDDVIIKLSTGSDMRKVIKGYTLEYLNILLGLICAIIIVAYINYTVSGELHNKFSYRLYYTSLFVIAGIMRYLQIVFVQNKAGSPTEILYKDRFIQLTLILWVGSFYVILYLKDLKFFE